MRLTDLTYEDWLEHAFGREVRIQQTAWFFDMIAIGGSRTGCCGSLPYAIVRAARAAAALVFG